MITSTIKTALRIRHGELDDELMRQEQVARSELKRLGISSTMAEGDSALVNEAVVTYCQWVNEDSLPMKEALYRAFELQADGIRKSTSEDI